jgi:peptide/nickel transport system substrate-binding protein
MRMKQPQILWLILLCLLALVLAGCGAAPPAAAPPAATDAPAAPAATDAPAAPAATDAPAAPAATDAPVAAAEPRRLVVAQGAGVESWDPPAGWDTASEWIEMNVYDCLVYPDRETGQIVGWLAESYENTAPTVWQMNLRQGVNFHNGTPFTAEDAKFSIDRIINGSREEFIVFDQWSFVKEVRIIDDYTIEIETTQPDPAFLSRLSGTGCGVVSKAYVEEVGADGLANEGIGTGPFKLKEYDRNSFVSLEANDDYWGGRPEIDELIFRVIPEVSTRVAELITGGVDVAPGVLPQDWDRVNATENRMITNYLTDRVWELTLAHTPPPGVEAVATSLPEIREAIDLAIDREELIDLVGGFGEPTLTRLTPPIPCWDEVDPPLYGQNPFDPDRARALLAEVGYPDVPGGPEIVLHSSFGQYQGQREIAETVAAMLEEVGFEVRLDIQEFSTFREGVYRGNNEELMLQSLGNFTTDPWLFVLNYNSRFGERISQRGRFSFPEVDELAVLADETMDPSERCGYVAEYAQKVAELRPSVILFQMSDSMGMPENLAWTPPSDGMLLFVNASFTD